MGMLRLRRLLTVFYKQFLQTEAVVSKALPHNAAGLSSSVITPNTLDPVGKSKQKQNKLQN